MKIINEEVIKEISNRCNVPEKEIRLILDCMTKKLTYHIESFNPIPFRIKYLGKIEAKPFRIYALNNKETLKQNREKEIQDKYRPKITKLEDGHIMVSYRKNVAFIMEENLENLIKEIDEKQAN